MTMPPLSDIAEPPPFLRHEGSSPLIVAAPHVGTFLPSDIADRLTEVGLRVGETDFHVHRLFDFASEIGASTLWATHSRYVIDLNRDRAGGALYPGRFETPLCPLTDFDLHPLYQVGAEPDQAEIARRTQAVWQPYHDALRGLIDKALSRHGHALLIDAHSIRPAIPGLFEGRLPDLNFGSHDGQACGGALLDVLHGWAATQSDYSHILDGRFKGGFTTRHYGNPARGVHTIQFEIVQDTYLNMMSPNLYDPAIAAPLSRALRPLVEALLARLGST